MTTKWKAFPTEGCFLLQDRKSPWGNALRGAGWARCLCPSSVPLCGATGPEESWIWPCRVATQGRRPLWQGKDISDLKHSVQCPGLCSVAPGRLSWAGRNGCVPGLHRRRWNPAKPGNHPMHPTAKWASVVTVTRWAKWEKQKPGRGKHRREFGKRRLALALSSTSSNSGTKDTATEVREHRLKGKRVQWNNTKRVLSIPNGN